MSENGMGEKKWHDFLLAGRKQDLGSISYHHNTITGSGVRPDCICVPRCASVPAGHPLFIRVRRSGTANYYEKTKQC
jgi:hypothetical protein